MHHLSLCLCVSLLLSSRMAFSIGAILFTISLMEGLPSSVRSGDVSKFGYCATCIACVVCEFHAVSVA